MADVDHGREILATLRDLRMPPGDYAVFGSAPLLVRGIIDSVGDLDVICRGAAWEHACRIGIPIEHGDATLMSVHDGAITFGRSWAYGTVDLDTLIDTADLIDGLPFVRLVHVLAYKRVAGRPKDLEHLSLVARHRGLGSGDEP